MHVMEAQGLTLQQPAILRSAAIALLLTLACLPPSSSYTSTPTSSFAAPPLLPLGLPLTQVVRLQLHRDSPSRPCRPHLPKHHRHRQRPLPRHSSPPPPPPLNHRRRCLHRRISRVSRDVFCPVWRPLGSRLLPRQRRCDPQASHVTAAAHAHALGPWTLQTGIAGMKSVTPWQLAPVECC